MDYKHAKFTASYTCTDQLPQSVRPEVSFVGRSNVGKSSLMNKLFNRKGLVKVSSKPGCTLAANFFNAKDVDFVDLPGYGFARVGQTEKGRLHELIEGYFGQNRTYALCVVLIDIRHEAKKLDKQMIAFLKARKIPFSIVFTKADKMSKDTADKQVRKLCTELGAPGSTIVITCSAVTGQGIKDLRALIDECLRIPRV